MNLSEEENEITHWKRNTVIGATILSVVMAISFGVYASQLAHEDECKRQSDSLGDRSVVGVILDYGDYEKEFADFKA